MKKYPLTLIEIMGVVALIVILMVIAIGAYSYASDASKEKSTTATITRLNNALASLQDKGISPLRTTGSSSTNGYVTVKFDAGEPIAYAEIMDDNAPVYTATADGKPYWRESDQEYVFAITFQNLGNFKDQLKGTLRIPGVPGAKWMFDSTSGFPTAVGKAVTGEFFNVNFNRRIEIKTPDVVIKVDPARSDLIETRIIGGVKYIMICADEDVEVNGVSINIKDDEKQPVTV
jgi:type II secretory pathway pseudopilin PulG